MDLGFTGEYCIPGESPKRVVDDHIERYRFAQQFVQGKTVLDIACGTGYGAKILAQAGALRVDGVDLSKDVIEYALETCKVENNFFFIGDICNYQSDISYDIVTCFETIEHIEDHQQALKNLYQLLHKDGLLIISSPNRIITSPRAMSIHDKPSNKFHVREFVIQEFKSALVDCGFIVDESNIFGQRQQRYYKNRILRMIYTKVSKPKDNASPVVTRVNTSVPRYVLIVAEKSIDKN